ncbi:ABC transporter ATP-binding protein [Fibrobacter sp. UBA4297]|uniref:ABC transporter ATP-binding protein n=1 Tax=Fibrobacter sp. UBA4297 TaxID=1946536 RepID=UPI0025BEFE1B|nr:ABC transporter ATP-binding protein [Fibrobacter sp. UBA4297]
MAKGERARMKYVAWLWRGTKGFRVNIVTRILAGAARVVCGLLMIWLSKRFIDETILTGTQDDILQMILLLVLTVVGTIVLRLLYFYMTASASVKKTNSLRLFYFGTLFRRKLFDGHELHSGDVTSRLSKDIETVSASIIDTLPQMAVTGIQLVGAFLLMRWFDARLAWALLLLTPVLLVVGKLISRRLRNMTLEIREGESRIQMQVQEGVEYNAVLRSLESENWVSERLGLKQDKLENDVMRRTRFTTVARFVIGSAFGLGYLLAFIWGGLGLRNGTITFGVMTSFLQLVGQIQHPILTLLGMVPQLVHSTASIDRLDELEKGVDGHSGLGRDEKSQSGMRKEMLLESPLEMRGRLGVRLDNVSFGYKGGDREIVCGFTHDFKPGSKNAVMGETGKGKTTLFRLLLGFVKPDFGRIELYTERNDSLTAGLDAEMRGCSVAVSEATRSNFVYVPQGNTLMNGSVRYNLQLAKPDATDEEMKQVLHIACAEFVNELPDDLDCEIGERGHGLSEGQAQRIAIARGLLRPGNILLFDEISSSLDEATEAELYRRLFDAFPEKTMIFVTHRTAVCEMCDETVRL